MLHSKMAFRNLAAKSDLNIADNCKGEGRLRDVDGVF